MRDHNDVIEFNSCNDLLVEDSKTPLRVKIRSNKCLSPGISIKKLQPGVENVKYQVGFNDADKVTIALLSEKILDQIKYMQLNQFNLSFETTRENFSERNLRTDNI